MDKISYLIANLDWGTVPDWFGALGTIAAVFVAIYLPFISTRPKGKAQLSFQYYTPQVELMGLEVAFYNTGSTAINVQSLSIGIIGSNKVLRMSLDFAGGVIQPGEGYSTGGSAVGIYETLQNIYGNDSELKVYPKVVDSIGNIYTGKSVAINLKSLRDDIKFQYLRYGLNPEVVDQEIATIFVTKKID